MRRTDKQKDSGLLLAIVDTVTLNRKTAMAVSDDNRTGGSVQKPRSFNDDNPPTAIPLRHERAVLPVPVPHREEDVSLLRSDRAEGV